MIYPKHLEKQHFIIQNLIYKSIVNEIQKGSNNIENSKKLPNTSIKYDDKLVNLIIEAGDLTNELNDINILSSIKSNPLLTYMNSSGKISYSDILRDISNNRFRYIILKDSALNYDPGNVNLILNRFNGNYSQQDKNNFQSNMRNNIILNSFYNDVINSQGKKLKDIKYRYNFRNDPSYDSYFEEKIMNINENMNNIYNIYRGGILEKWLSTIEKLKSTRSKFDDVLKIMEKVRNKNVR